MAVAEEEILTLSIVKKEPEGNSDLEDHHSNSDLEDHHSNSDKDEITPVKEEIIIKDDSDDTAAKSDVDMQGYDTRSEVASSLSSDSDSEGAASSKSFDVKRKRQSRITSYVITESNKKSESVSPLKKNSANYIRQLNYLFRDARFFVIKSSNSENITLSKVKGVWATLPQNQIRLSEAFHNSGNVILIFSAKESGKFSGFARLATEVDRSISPIPWVVPAELTANLLKGTFHIDWICRKDLPFSFTTTLYNPWNCNKPVKIARDGQEVEPRVGEKLCRLFPEDDTVDIAPILRKSKDAAKNRAVKQINTPVPMKGLYTAKYRSRLLHHNNVKERTLSHRVHESHYISKHYKYKGSQRFFLNSKKGPLPRQLINSIETHVKRYGHSFRPPLPLSLPFMPPPPKPYSGDMFSPKFRTLPFSHPPPMPRYYDPSPTFPYFAKMNLLPHPKNVYDRSVEEFLFKTRDNEFYSKKEDRIRRKENDKGKRVHYHDRR